MRASAAEDYAGKVTEPKRQNTLRARMDIRMAPLRTEKHYALNCHMTTEPAASAGADLPEEIGLAVGIDDPAGGLDR